MTYRDLLYKATRLANKGEITLGEYEEMTKPLDREIEQEPKSEWEQDHAILKAYSDGANEMLDKIRAEIDELDVFRFSSGERTYKDERIDKEEVLDIINKYKAESEDKE